MKENTPKTRTHTHTRLSIRPEGLLLAKTNDLLYVAGEGRINQNKRKEVK